MKDGNERFAARARAVFDSGVERVDGRVRSRLTQARHAAVGELARPAIWRGGWVPATAVAAVGVLAVALWLQPGAPGGAPSATPTVAALDDDLDLLAAGDDLELLQEDLEFYAWAAQAEPGNGIG